MFKHESQLIAHSTTHQRVPLFKKDTAIGQLPDAAQELEKPLCLIKKP
jgi:hypothetical protein